jgi:hypothetical protein
MTDPTQNPAPAAPPAESAAPLPPPRRWWRRWKLILTSVVLLPIALFALYTLIALNWSYSQGERAGYVQKFSRKGWVCKTWEGELALSTVPGVAPTMWYFSVRNGATARQVSIANGRRVIVYYKEHRGIPTTCFGDTSYFVDSIRIVR